MSNIGSTQLSEVMGGLPITFDIVKDVASVRAPIYPGVVQTVKLKGAMYGDSTANFGTTQSPATNDTSLVTAPIPASGTTTVSINTDKAFLELLIPNLELVTNCGVSGRTNATALTDEQSTSTSTTRKVADLTNNSPHFVLFRGASINDFVGASYPISDAAYNVIVANYKIQLGRLASLNVPIICEGIYGYSLGLPGYPTSANGDAIRAAVIRFGKDIQGYISSLNNPNLVYVDSVGLNCTDTGAYITGHTLLSDGIHNSVVGAYYRALRLKSVLETLFGPSQKVKHIGKNLQINPLFSLTTASLGITPTNYSWSSPTNCTRQNGKVEVIDGVIWATMEWLVTATASMGGQVGLPFNPLATGTNPLNIAVNDVYGFEYDFFLQNVTSGVITHLSTLTARVRWFDVTNAKSVVCDLIPGNASDAGAGIPGKLILHFAPPPIKFQDAAAALGTSSTWTLNFALDATAGDIVKCGISNPRIVKLA